MLETQSYSKTARVKDNASTGLHNSNLDQSLDNESNNFDMTRSSRKNKSLLGRSRNQESSCPASDMESFNKTSSKLFNASFKHHDAATCVCQYCNCGRHLCKFKCIKPDLPKGSTYKMSYDRKTPIPNNINRASEYDRLNGPHLDLGTNNKIDYNGKQGDIPERHRPEDLLKTGGPSQNLTSYSSGFPGFKGANQYIKPSDSAVRADFPMMSRSTYANSFVPKSSPKPHVQKIPDNLKSRDLWMGKTTYGNFFQQPNPEDYVKRNQNAEKLNNNPNYNHQYGTN